MVERFNLSAPEEHAEWLEQNPQITPSGLLKWAIENHQEAFASSAELSHGTETRQTTSSLSLNEVVQITTRIALGEQLTTRAHMHIESAFNDLDESLDENTRIEEASFTAAEQTINDVNPNLPDTVAIIEEIIGETEIHQNPATESLLTHPEDPPTAFQESLQSLLSNWLADVYKPAEPSENTDPSLNPSTTTPVSETVLTSQILSSADSDDEYDWTMDVAQAATERMSEFTRAERLAVIMTARKKYDLDWVAPGHEEQLSSHSFSHDSFPNVLTEYVDRLVYHAYWQIAKQHAPSNSKSEQRIPSVSVTFEVEPDSEDDPRYEQFPIVVEGVGESIAENAGIDLSTLSDGSDMSAYIDAVYNASHRDLITEAKEIVHTAPSWDDFNSSILDDNAVRASVGFTEQ